MSVIGKKAFGQTKSFLSREEDEWVRRRRGIIDRAPSDVRFSSRKDAKSSFWQFDVLCISLKE